jgi:hypothetical protein
MTDRLTTGPLARGASYQSSPEPSAGRRSPKGMTSLGRRCVEGLLADLSRAATKDRNFVPKGHHCSFYSQTRDYEQMNFPEIVSRDEWPGRAGVGP